MSALDRVKQAASSKRSHSPTSTELDWADLQVANAQTRIERLAALIDDDVQNGRPTRHTRALLATCHQVLREMIAHRDMVFAEHMTGRSERQPVERRTIAKVVTVHARGHVIAKYRIALHGPIDGKAFVERALHMAKADGSLYGIGRDQLNFSVIPALQNGMDE